MKRVLHVMASLERSGMEQMLLSSATEWHAAGYTCDVVSTAPEVGPAAEAMRECGYGVYHLPFRSKHRLLPRAGFMREFYRLCAQGYDVVHIQVEAGRPLFALIARMAGVRRLAVTPHSTFRFTGLLRMRKMAERHLIRLLGGRFGMISESVQKCEWERFRIRGERIWNWINSDYFRPPTAEERSLARKELGLEGAGFVVVSVANCSHVKNHPALLEALALLHEDERPVYLHVGREEEGQPERRLAEQLRITGTTCFVGSQPDPRSYFWAADAVVMPSLYEGVGLSAIEAVACGLPLVCTRIDGLRDLAREMETCIMTSTDPEAIADGLREVMRQKPEEQKTRGQRDSARIREMYSLKNGVASVIENLYSERRKVDVRTPRVERELKSSALNR
ncbi:MAG: glycosyltransferase [Terracidiphilus sp.]|nr:glycosyltransferase [Terracidiphilus sp.]